MFWYFSICLQREAEYWRCYRFRQLWRHAHKRCAGDVCLLRHFCIFIVWKQLTRMFFFHSHNTLQILKGDCKVTGKLAKNKSPFSYSMMMLDFLFSHSTVSSCCWFIFQARLLLENNSLARFNFPFKYYPRDSNN